MRLRRGIMGQPMGKESNQAKEPLRANSWRGVSSFFRSARTWAVASFALSLVVAARDCGRETAARLEATHRRELQGVMLGRRASVFESLHASVDSVVAHEHVSPARWASAAQSDSFKYMLEEEELSQAAREVNVSLDAEFDAPWLDLKIVPQLRDRYGAQMVDAYNVGRLLGYCDERVMLCLIVSPSHYEFGSCKPMADSASFRESAAYVDSISRVLGCPIRMAWTWDGGIWARLAQGRAMLNDVVEWLENDGVGKPLWEKHPRVDGRWLFRVVLRRDSGGPAGYTTVIMPDILTRTNEAPLMERFREVAWRPQAPGARRPQVR